MEILFRHNRDVFGQKYIAQRHPTKRLPKTAFKVGEKLWCMPAHKGVGTEEWFPVSTYIEHQGAYYQVHKLDSANVFSPRFEVL